MCRILERCATVKIRKLQFRDLYIEFEGTEAVVDYATPIKPMTQEEHTQLNDAQVQRDAEELRQIEIDELILTDPEKYEELLQKGEI